MSDPISLGASGIAIFDFLIKPINKVRKKIVESSVRLYISSEDKFDTNNRKLLNSILISEKKLNMLTVILVDERKNVDNVKPFFRSSEMAEINEQERRIANVIKIVLSNEVKKTISSIRNIDNEMYNIISAFINFVNKGTLCTVLEKDTSIDCFQINNNEQISVNVEIDSVVLLEIIKSMGFGIAEIDWSLIMYGLRLWDFPDEWVVKVFFPKMMYDVMLMRDINELSKINVVDLFTTSNWKVGLH